MYKVPYGLRVEVSIRRDSEAAHVDVYAPMYLNKYWTMRHSYCLTWSDMEIIRDRTFITVMLDHYPI